VLACHRRYIGEHGASFVLASPERAGSMQEAYACNASQRKPRRTPSCSGASMAGSDAGLSSASSTSSTAKGWFVPDFDPLPSYLPLKLLGGKFAQQTPKASDQARGYGAYGKLQTAQQVLRPNVLGRSRRRDVEDASSASFTSSARSVKVRRHFSRFVPEDSDSDGLEEQPELDIIVGPTSLAFGTMVSSDIHLPSAGGVQGTVALRSHAKQLSVGDCFRLASAAAVPMSFGSAAHIMGMQQSCRPCMFEHWPGRCKKSWLCDFCHGHDFREIKASSKKSRKEKKLQDPIGPEQS